MHYARSAVPGGEWEYRGTVEPLSSILAEHDVTSYSGPTTPHIGPDGTIHFTFGYWYQSDGDNDFVDDMYYVRLPPSGEASVRALDTAWRDFSEEDPAGHAAVQIDGLRTWVLFTRGWEGRTFLIESLDGGTTFTDPIELVPERGRLFYGASSASQNRPLTMLADGRPLVTTSWYVLGSEPSEKAVVAFPLFDPLRPPALHGEAALLAPRLAPSIHLQPLNVGNAAASAANQSADAGRSDDAAPPGKNSTLAPSKSDDGPDKTPSALVPGPTGVATLAGLIVAAVAAARRSPPKPPSRTVAGQRHT